MTPQEITAFFARHQEAYDNLDVAALAGDYAEDCVLESPIAGTVVGRTQVEKTFRTLFTAFPDLKVHKEDLLIIGDRVVQTATFSGTDTGGFLELAPTGKPFRVLAIFLFTVKDQQIVRERRSYDFSGFLLQLAGDLRIGIESARLYRELLERTQLEHEVAVAAQIQRALLPEARYCGSGFEVVAASMPCRAIGGDFFDYFELSSGAFGFALGDVAGKGPPAALLTAVLQGIFAVHAHLSQTPAEVLTDVNHVLGRRAIEARFVTVVYGVLSRDGRLTYCNAGHNPPILVRGQSVRRLETGGTVLGLFTQPTFEQETVQLCPNDVLVVFSDGITEAMNIDSEQFGDDRLVACVQDSCHLAPEPLLEGLFDKVRAFSTGVTQADDLTALILRYTGA